MDWLIASRPFCLPAKKFALAYEYEFLNSLYDPVFTISSFSSHARAEVNSSRIFESGLSHKGALVNEFFYSLSLENGDKLMELGATQGLSIQNALSPGETSFSSAYELEKKRR